MTKVCTGESVDVALEVSLTVPLHQYCLPHPSLAAGTFHVLTPADKVPEEVHPVPVIVSLSQILNAYRTDPPTTLRP